MEKETVLIKALTRDLPKGTANLNDDRVIIGRDDHPCRTDREYPRPAYQQPYNLRGILPEFCYVLSGEMILKKEEAFYCLKKGDYGLVRRMEQHYESFVASEVPYEVLWFRFYFVDRLVISHAAYARNRYQVQGVLHVTVPPALLKTFNSLDGIKALDAAFIKNKLDGLYAVIGQKMRNKEYFYHPLEDTGKKWKQKSLYKVNEYIEQHLDEKLTLADIARHLNISSNYLSSLYKKEYGGSVYECVIFKRMEKAVALLRETQLSITEIADRTDFRDIYYFSRLFKKYYGISPRELRDKYL